MVSRRYDRRGGSKGKWEREEELEEERVRCGVVEDMREEQTGSAKMQFSQMSTTWYADNAQ